MPTKRQFSLPGMEPDEESAPQPIEAAPQIDSPTESAPATSSSTSLAGKSVWVVDANSLIFQVFHAIPEMTSPQGLPVSAVFGFTRDLLFLLETKKPDYLFVAFDTPEPTFRHELFPDYKGTRSEMPVDLIPQFPAIKRIIEALNVSLIEAPGYEADDVLATIAEACDQAGANCFVVSDDKDCRQLISDRVQIYNVRKNSVIDAAALKEDWGIRPDQVVDYQTLVGDSVDNIPGVPLIGPKIARELLEKYETLDNLLAKADELPKGKRKENLLAGKEQALVSRVLCQLDRHVPIEIDWRQAHTGEHKEEPLFELFAVYGFHSFGARVANLPRSFSAEYQAAEQIVTHYQAVDTPEKFSAFLAELGKQQQVSLDTETLQAYPHPQGMVWPRWANIVGYSFSWKDTEGYYLPVRAPAGEAQLDPATTLEALRPVLTNPAIEKVGQNLKYDMVVLRTAGVEVAGAHFDTMVASYLLDAGERNHNLDELAQRYLRHTTIKISSLIGAGKAQKRMDQVPVALITDYAAEDADIAWRLKTPLAARLTEAKLDPLFHTLEMPLVEVLTELEYNGIRIDVPFLKKLSGQFGETIARLEQEIYAIAGQQEGVENPQPFVFNINSVKQLQEVLFDKLKLPVIKKTQTGRSTDVEVLEELATIHALPAKLLEYRQYSKLKGTYIDALPEMVHPETHRVHASFRQDVAATGRLSSENPNLQNIPIRSEAGKAIREAFLPGHEGWQLLAADYSQIELRVLAHYCGDQELCEAFARDEDIHARVAAQVYGVPLEQVSSAQRRNAKAVNFGIIYGQSPFGLAKALSISKDEAAEFIDKYFARYQGVEAFMNGILQECLKTGYVYTILGRRRAISGVRANGGRQRNLPERTAINTVIQGSAADLIKLAMIAIHRKLKSGNSRSKMLLQIHDELVFECPPEELQPIGELVRGEMAGVMQLNVPLKIDVKSGPNWGACEVW